MSQKTTGGLLRSQCVPKLLWAVVNRHKKPVSFDLLTLKCSGNHFNMFTNTQEPPVNNLSPGILWNTEQKCDLENNNNQRKKLRNHSFVASGASQTANFSIDHLCLAWIVSAPDILYMMGAPTWSWSCSLIDEVRLKFFQKQDKILFTCQGRAGPSTPHLYLSFMQILPSLFYVMFRTFLKLLKEG